MEAYTFDKQKISLAQTILSLSDPELTLRIEAYVKELLKNDSLLESEEVFDANKLSFEEWNEQFEDDYILDDYIEEHGITVKEYRMQLYAAEKGEGMSKETLFEKLEASV